MRLGYQYHLLGLRGLVAASMRPRRMRLGYLDEDRDLLVQIFSRFNEAEAHAPRILFLIGFI